jgi:hypothetical protein
MVTVSIAWFLGEFLFGEMLVCDTSALLLILIVPFPI